MQLTEIAWNQLASAKSCQTIVVFKARRNIEPLEQLLWDYKDGEARDSWLVVRRLPEINIHNYQAFSLKLLVLLLYFA